MRTRPSTASLQERSDPARVSHDDWFRSRPAMRADPTTPIPPAVLPAASPEQLRIVHRPEEIQHRQLPGHWEGDFIKGAFNRSAVGTLVERQTRFVVLCRMDGCTAQDALEGFTRQLGKMPAFLRQSLTYDRVRRWPVIANWPSASSSISGSLTLTPPGSGVATRTLTACCVSSCSGRRRN